MKTLYAEKRESIPTPFAGDKFFELPGTLASWVEKKGRKRVEIAEDGESWHFKVNELTNKDLAVLAMNRLDYVGPIDKKRLLVKVRK
jgi:hypothetical protein